MTSPTPNSPDNVRRVFPGGWSGVVLVAIDLAGLALAARLLVAVHEEASLPYYVALLVVFFVLFTGVWLRPALKTVWLYPIFVVQCVVVILLLLLDPNQDYATSLFPLLSYQAALAFSGRVRWIWIGILALASAVPLMATLGPAKGLGLGLITMAITVAFPALALASQEIEDARQASRAMVGELEATNQRLREYAEQVEDLAVLEERNRLARELHDSVSQAMFGIVLATRSAQIMLEKEPEAVPAQVERLQGLTQEALVRMRGFIAELRPKS